MNTTSQFFNRTVSLSRVFFTSALVAALGTGAASYQIGQDIKADLVASLPQPVPYKLDTTPQVSKILSRDGKLVATLFKEHQKPIALADMGDKITKALIAIEDQRFYDHDGVDYRGIARAAVANLRSEKVSQGASTLTMQLARKFYLSQERSYERKLKEVLLARRMEKRLSKEQILEAYLNEAYFGAGAYGVSAAANRYFRVAPSDLTTAQAALLAGLVQSPTYLNPIDNPIAARQRQLVVLEKMLDLDMIDAEEYELARREAIDTDFQDLDSGAKKPMLKYPYFTTYAIRQLAEKIDEERLYNGGLTVQTSLDLKAQKMMERVVASQISTQGAHYGVDSSAAVLIHNESGEIRAMVGGQKWSQKDRFNRAWQSERQPGSTFKPFLYASAMQRGFGQNSMVEDKEITLLVDGETKTWSPENFDGKEKGEIPLREALRLSRNQAAVHLVSQVGYQPLLKLAKLSGVETSQPRVPSVALGSGGVSPLEMARAYSTFANQGVSAGSTSFTHVQGPNGDVLLRGDTRWTKWAMAPETATTMTDMMMRVVRAGTGRAAFLPGVQVAGKTGTTDSYKDAWFVGYTPKYTLAVWMGNDDNTPTNKLTGGDLPAETWRKIMKNMDHQGETRFTFLSKVPETRTYCKQTHLIATDDCEKSYREDFYAPISKDDDCEECEEAAKEKKAKTVSIFGKTNSYPKAK